MTDAGERGGGSAVAGPPSEEETRAAEPAAEGRTRSWRVPRISGLWGLIRGHRVFTAALALGAGLRLVALLGYRPASWFNDSFDYLHVAMAPYPHAIRPDGYSFLLWALRPLHSFAMIAAIQHLMGLAMAVMIYALARRRFGLPGWGAALTTVPVLFDGYQIQLEHLILSDTMFGFLLVTVITLLLWHDRALTWKMGAVAGLLLGLMSLTRSVGMPVLLAVVVYFLIRRINWRVIVATLALCALPLAGYAGWFYAYYGKIGMTNSNGVFLYSRVTAFADCDKVDPPVSEYPLCTMPDNRLPFSQDAIWDRRSPFHRIPSARFTAFQNQLAGDFAKRAILAQPLDYAQTVAADFFRTFKWERSVFPDRSTYQMYQFEKKSAKLPSWRMSGDRTAAAEAQAYEHGSARTRVVGPYATVIRVYQRYVYLHGTLLGGILIVGLAGLVPLWRRWGGPALLPWITATGLLLAPAATAEFDYRYVLPVVPLACLAAGITFSRVPRQKIAGLFRRGNDTTAEPTADPPAAEPKALAT